MGWRTERKAQRTGREIARRAAVFFVGWMVLVAVAGCSTFTLREPSAEAITIEVAPGWGEARTEDVGAVLASVASELLRFVPLERPVAVVVHNSGEGPTVRYRRAQGTFVVLVHIDGRRWAQLAYQFSHELCHILSNYHRRNRAGGDANGWFEEALCEAVSFFALARMAESWRTRPPYPNWQSYSAHLSSYLEAMVGDEASQLPSGTSLADWFAENERMLVENRYDRPGYAVAALHLYRRLLDEPEMLGSIAYLNRWGGDGTEDLCGYLSAWRRHSPAHYRPFVERVSELFGSGAPECRSH
jgi:hypothetical protein